MRILRSLASAFLMYSKIPMPRVAWKAENRRYALCCFPLVGAVIGGLFLLWRALCAWMQWHWLVSSIGSVCIPVLVTGGIHLDGFCDVIDAKASHGEKSQKLAILQDPHIGAFAVLWLCLYLLAQTALFAQMERFSTAAVVACGFPLSRALSALAAVTLRSAKKEGTLFSFTQPAAKRATVAVLLATAAALAATMVCIQPVTGALALLGALLSICYYRISAYRQFGGVTGDLAGWFLQTCELWMLLFATAGEFGLEGMGWF